MSFFLYITFLALTYLRPVETFAPELAPYRPLLLFAVVVLTASVASSNRGKQLVVSKVHGLLMGGLLISIVMSQATRGWLSGGIDAFVDVIPAAILFLLTLLNVNSLYRLRVTCLTIATCMCLLAVGSVSALYTGYMADRLVLRQGGDGEEIAGASEISESEAGRNNFLRIRSLGTFADPNDFAQAMIVAVTFLIALWVKGSWLRNLTYRLIPAGFLLFAIYLTFSRGALIGLGAIFFMLLKPKLGNWKTTLLLVAFGIAAIAIGFGGGRTFSSSDESAGGRIEAWSEGLIMLKNHPFFGVGYGSFRDHHPYAAHNSFVHCFAELGLIGYFFWLALQMQAWIALGKGIKSANEDSEARHFAITLRISYIGFLTCSFFLSRCYTPPLYILLALMMCAGAIAQNVNSQRNEILPVESIPFRSTMIVALLSILLIYGVVIINRILLAI